MKVLITSLSAGSGHVRAAQALQAAFHETAPQVLSVHIDVANFVRPEFRRVYVEGYRLTVNHAPELWGRFYRFWDQQPQAGVMVPLLQWAQRAFAGSFYNYVQRFQPDVILTTHFLIPQLLAHRSSASIETVITDYDVHRFWVSDTVSRYHVAHPGMTQTLKEYGVAASRVQVSGIPVHPDFLQPVAPSRIFRELGLNPRHRVILVLSGGLGLNEMEYTVQQLFSLPANTQILTVSGKNAALRDRLNKLQPPEGLRLINLGYVSNMHELLSVSDLVLTKPGGLTVSECLAKNKLMVLFSPIPGQEEKNADFLISRGAAVRVSHPRYIPGAVMRLLGDARLRARLLTHVQQCARPQAAYTIVDSLTNRLRIAA